MNKSVHAPLFVPSKQLTSKSFALNFTCSRSCFIWNTKKCMCLGCLWYVLPDILFIFFLYFFRGHRGSWTARERNCTMLKFYWKLLSIYGNYMYFIPLEGGSYLQSYTEELSLSFKKIIKTKIIKKHTHLSTLWMLEVYPFISIRIEWIYNTIYSLQNSNQIHLMGFKPPTCYTRTN